MKKLIIYIIALSILSPVCWATHSEKDFASAILASMSLASHLEEDFTYDLTPEPLIPFYTNLDSISGGSDSEEDFASDVLTSIARKNSQGKGFTYNSRPEPLVHPYKKKEIEFLDLNEDQTNTSASDENICTVFKESLVNGFSTYLTLKNKFLYINKFMPSDFSKLKNELKLHQKESHPKEDIQWPDYFLNFIYIKMIYPCQSNNLNIEKYNLKNSADQNAILLELQKLHPCASSLYTLLARCPTAIFLENEDRLIHLYPNFHKNYQATRQNKTNISSSMQESRTLRFPVDHPEKHSNEVPRIQEHKNTSEKKEELLKEVEKLASTIDPATLTNLNDKDWEEKAKELKKNCPSQKESGFGGLATALDRLKKNQNCDPSLLPHIKNLAKASQRIYNNQKGPKNNITPEVQDLLKKVQDLIEKIDSATLTKFDDKDWEEKAKELKKNCPSQKKSSFSGLATALDRLKKNQNCHPSLLPHLKNLSNASQRIYNNQEAPKKNLSSKMQDLLKKVQDLTATIDPAKLPELSNKDWEKIAKELKKNCPSQKESGFDGLGQALNKLRKNENCDPSLFPHLKNLANAAKRIYKNIEAPKNNLSPKMQDLLKKVQDLTTAIDPAKLPDFSNKDWEEKAEELKMNSTWSYYGLHTALYNLSKNENCDGALMMHLQNLAKAARRIYRNIEAPKNSLSVEMLDLLKGVKELTATIDPAKLPELSNKDWEQKARELKDKCPSKKKSTFARLAEAINKLRKNQNCDQALLPYLKALSKAAKKIYTNEKAPKNKISPKMQVLLKQVKELIEKIDAATLPHLNDKDWEEKATELKEKWPSKKKNSFATFGKALDKLTKNQNCDPSLLPHLKNLAKASQRIYDNQEAPKKNLSSKMQDLLKKVQELITTIDPAKLPELSNKDWEKKATDLKENCPSQKENAFYGFRQALDKLRKNQNCPQALLPCLKALSNAAQRIYTDEEAPKNNTSSEMQDLLKKVKELTAEIDPARLLDFSDKDWKEKTKELRMNSTWSYYRLHTALYNLSKNENCDAALMLHLQNLAKAARRIYDNQRNPNNNISSKMQVLLEEVKRFVAEIDPARLSDFSDKDWKEKATELKINGDWSYSGFWRALYKLTKNQNYDPALLPHLQNLLKLARRIYENQKVPNNNISSEKKDLLKKVKELTTNIDPATLPNFSNEDWEKKATELKNNFPFSFSGLHQGLDKLKKNQNCDPALLPYLKALSNAATRLYRNKEAPKNTPSSESQDILAKVKALTAKIDPPTLADFSNEDWEEKARELKESCPSQKKSGYSGLQQALIKLSKNQNCDALLVPHLQNLSNAAQRIYENDEGPKKNLSPEMKDLLEKIRELTATIDPATLAHFSNKDWEEKARELKENCPFKKKSGYAGFYSTLDKLRKNLNSDPALLSHLQNLENAAQRIYRNEEASKNNITAEMQELQEEIKNLITNIDPAALTDFNDKDWEEKATELKENCPSKKKRTFFQLYNALHKLSKNKNCDQTLLPHFQNLEKATQRIYENQEDRKKNLSPKMKELQEEIKKLIANIDPAALPDFLDKDWEEKATEFKENDAWSFSGLHSAIYKLTKNQNVDQALLPHLKNLAKAARRIHIKKNKLNPTEPNPISTKTNKDKTSILGKRIDSRPKKKPAPKKLKDASSEKDEPKDVPLVEDLTFNQNQTELSSILEGSTDHNQQAVNKNLSTSHEEDDCIEIQKPLDNSSNTDLLPTENADKNTTSMDKRKKQITSPITLLPLVENFLHNIDPAALPNFKDKDWEEKATEFKENGAWTFSGLHTALYKLSKNQNFDQALLPHLKNLTNAARRIHKRKNKLNTTEPNPVSTKTNENNASILGKRTQNRPKKKPAPKKLKDTSSEKNEPLVENLTFNQNQIQISSNLEASTDHNHQIINLDSPPINDNRTEIKNTNKQDILDKIKNYTRSSSFEANSVLHQLIETKDFFDIIQKQIFDLVDYPRIFTILTDVLMNNSFSNETKRSTFNILSDFVLSLRQNKKPTNFIDEETFALIAAVASEQDWKEDQWIDFAELYTMHPQVIEFIAPKTDLVLE